MLDNEWRGRGKKHTSICAVVGVLCWNNSKTEGKRGQKCLASQVFSSIFPPFCDQTVQGISGRCVFFLSDSLSSRFFCPFQFHILHYHYLSSSALSNTALTLHLHLPQDSEGKCWQWGDISVAMCYFEWRLKLVLLACARYSQESRLLSDEKVYMPQCEKESSLCLLSMRLVYESLPSPAVSVPSYIVRKALIPTFSSCVKKLRIQPTRGLSAFLCHLPPPLFFFFIFFWFSYIRFLVPWPIA